jgi:fatty-acyl-CoA synthase
MAEPPWVDGLTFSQMLARTVEASGGRDALVFPKLGYRRSYAEFQKDVRQAAKSFLALGVERGENIGIWASNWPQWVITQFATAEIGAVLVNVNPAYREQELRYVLNQADITTLVMTDQVKTSNFFNIFAGICPELTDCADGELRSSACPKLRRVISIKENKRTGMQSWTEFLSHGDRISDQQLERRRIEVGPSDVVNIQYTSGTTGFPKGAMLTHRNLLLNAYYVGQGMAFTPEDRLCIPVPFYHCFGCVMGTLMCAIYGAAMVIPAEIYCPEATLEAIQAERCTGIYGVPTMFIAELQHPRFPEFDLSSLRTGVMAGSPCPIELMKHVVGQMGAREITIGYGLTEASPIITQTRTDDSLEHRVGTVGRPLPGLDVRVTAPGGIEPLPDGSPGELQVRGHGVMKGYFNKPIETADAFTIDGWLHTGDVAMRTPDGYYRITGRIKDMICRGGENIYPREIEEFLYTHPQIADVQIVGLPDEKMGEEVSAWIRVKAGATLTEDAVRCFCRGKIAHFKIPRYVVFVDQYPSTVTGKVQKFKLRELGVEKFGLQKAASVETA